MGTWRLVDAHISARYHIESLSRMFTTGKRVFLKYVQYTHDRGPMYTSVLSALTRRQAFDIQTHYTLLKSAVADRRPPRMRTLTDALSWSNDETYALYPCTIPWSPVYFLRASVSVPFAISAPFGDRDQTIWQSVKDVTERDVTSKSTKKQSRQRDPKHWHALLCQNKNNVWTRDKFETQLFLILLYLDKWRLAMPNEIPHNERLLDLPFRSMVASFSQHGVPLPMEWGPFRVVETDEKELTRAAVIADILLRVTVMIIASIFVDIQHIFRRDCDAHDMYKAIEIRLRRHTLKVVRNSWRSWWQKLDVLLIDKNGKDVMWGNENHLTQPSIPFVVKALLDGIAVQVVGQDNTNLIDKLACKLADGYGAGGNIMLKYTIEIKVDKIADLMKRRYRNSHNKLRDQVEPLDVTQKDLFIDPNTYLPIQGTKPYWAAAAQDETI